MTWAGRCFVVAAWLALPACWSVDLRLCRQAGEACGDQMRCSQNLECQSVAGNTRPGETCDTAETVDLAGPRPPKQTTHAYANDYNPSDGACSGYPGPDRTYRTLLPARRRLKVTIAPFNEELGLAVHVYQNRASACGQATGCTSNRNTSVTLDNPTQEALVVFVVVDSPGDRGGEFNITFEVSTL